MHTRQWIGTYAGRGNGDYLGELAVALRSITTYLKRFALTPEVALVRLDGQYGDAVAMAQLLEAGVYFVTRASGYHVPFASADPRRVGSSPDSKCNEGEER